MTDEKDIYRAAQLLITQYGADAEEHAMSKYAQFCAREDVVAASAWLMIAQTIVKLAETIPPNKDMLH